MTIQNYITELQDLLNYLPIAEINKTVEVIDYARRERMNVFILGNGGSASTASHMVCDLIKGTFVSGVPDIRARELADNTAILTAYSNDEDYQRALVYHLEVFLNPGDVVIGISTSGNSPNILKAINYANANDAITVGLTGFDGGSLADMVKINIHIPSNCIEQVEDCHLIIGHIFTQQLRKLALKEVN